MKATIPWASAFLGIALTASPSPPLIYTYYSPVYQTPLQVAPDACGPGFYAVCPNGVVYRPNYYLAAARNAFCTHDRPGSSRLSPLTPYVRSPRGFLQRGRENMEDQMRRNQRPALWCLEAAVQRETNKPGHTAGFFVCFLV